jgi:predicted MFS family arabinose efflux permease
MAPFATYLISNFSWRTAYFVIGLIAWLIVIPLSRLLKRDPYEIGALPDGVKSVSHDIGEKEDGIRLSGLSLSQVFRTRSFWLVIFIFLLFASNIFLVMTHLVRHARDINFSPMEAATVLSLIGGISIVGRVILGIASDRVGRKVTVIFCALLQAGAMVWLIWAQDLWMLYLFALVYGFAFGGISPVMAALVSDTFGLGRIGTIFGLLDISFGVGAAIGPLMGGLIFEARGSYSLAFLLGAVAMVIVTLLISLIRQETNRNFEVDKAVNTF